MVLELKKHYLNFKKEIDQEEEKSQFTEEKSLIVFTSEWVRIYLSADIRLKFIKIQVEVFPSVELVKKTFIKNDNEFIKTNEPYLKEIIENQLKNLNYLIKLLEFGFTLGFISEEGIWYCSKILESEPSNKFSKLINPP